MGRNKLIEDEKLLDLFDNFLLEVCGEIKCLPIF